MIERFRRFLIRVGALAAKEALHIRRDPRTLYLALVMPVVMLLIFGYGVSFDIDHIPVALVDLDRTPESREIARRLFASKELESVGEVASAPDAELLLRAGKALGFVTLPVGAGRDLARGETVTLQLVGGHGIPA
ncbi:MAG: ABC transporter permease, partial [Deltaproteobacteria bacterium]|nr:ABC transporter permease [Deltaproteobacteria bacterium]